MTVRRRSREDDQLLAELQATPVGHPDGAGGHLRGARQHDWPPDGTYLDVAVDGAEQVYLLYFTGTGTAPADYRVDVYNADGSPLATHSPGVNVPHLAVDYWRSIFAANYAPLANLGTTTAHVSPALGVPEPSVSRFDPVQP